MNFDQLSSVQRINVVGTSGSGKSTFARELSRILNLPLFEMDRLYWKPDWQSLSDEELHQKVREVTSQSAWILDGNYTRTIPIKWQHVQLVIWLDMSFIRTIWRVTRRSLRRAWSRTELWPETGNRESFARSFLSADSVIWWSMTTHGRNRRHYSTLMQSPDYSHVPFLRLSTPAEVQSCLSGFRNAVNQSPLSDTARAGLNSLSPIQQSSVIPGSR